jgi:hypothetical protein
MSSACDQFPRFSAALQQQERVRECSFIRERRSLVSALLERILVRLARLSRFKSSDRSSHDWPSACGRQINSRWKGKQREMILRLIMPELP